MRKSCIWRRPIVILALAGIALSCITKSDALAESATDNDSMTYVFLLNPECNDGFRDKFEYYMHLNNTSNERFLGYYEVVCMGGVENLGDIEGTTVPLLRQSYPSDTFVFVYPESMKGQYSDYLATKYGEAYRNAARGSSDVPQGIAYAMEFPETVKHEMSHLSICGTWHDEYGQNLDHILKHPEAENLAWCS
jgi:hypothetical protein